MVAAPPTLSAPGVVERPDLTEDPLGLNDAGWIVTVYDNNHNTYEEVMTILMVATGCTADEAYMETWEIDHLGRSVVHSAAESECRRVGEVIATIGIRVEVSQE
jgi:hypothetical protein